MILMTTSVKANAQICSLFLTAIPVKSSYLSALTTNSATFQRPHGAQGKFYFVDIEVIASISGIYKLVADSGIDTFGCLYYAPFNASNPSSNLIAMDDDNGPASNFQFELNLVRSWSAILVVTTFSASETAPFNITVYGPAQVTFRSMFRFPKS